METTTDSTGAVRNSEGEIVDQVLGLPYAVHIQHLETGDGDTKCRLTLGEAICAAYETARVAVLSNQRYRLRILFHPTACTPQAALLEVQGSYDLLAALRDAVAEMDVKVA